MCLSNILIFLKNINCKISLHSPTMSIIIHWDHTIAIYRFSFLRHSFTFQYFFKMTSDFDLLEKNRVPMRDVPPRKYQGRLSKFFTLSSSIPFYFGVLQYFQILL